MLGGGGRFKKKKNGDVTKAQWAGFFRGEKRPGDFLFFFFFGYWYILNYEEMMKQVYKIFTFSRGIFSHIQTPWCMYSFI